MRSLAWFLGVAALHFALSAAGAILGLRAAFDTQVSFWAAPVAASLSYLSGVLMAPLAFVRPMLPAGWRDGYAEIAVVSVLFGAAAVALLHLGRALRSRRARQGISRKGEP
jgi:pheromone shutdown protein TraB